jgi:acyl carrier protein
VVLVREDPLGERRVVAYVASGGAAPTFITELRSFLRERLPDYMVPAAIVVLERFPLGPSGKVDRGALPAPELGEPVEVGSFLAPAGPVEEGLARIWGELLGLERISAAADFFELGGHSLLATRAVSRVRETFGVELPLRTLFEAPTLSGLAARIAAALPAPVTPASVTPAPVTPTPVTPASVAPASVAPASVTPASVAPGPPIVARDRRGPSPLSYAQQRLWFLDQLAPGCPLYNVPVAMRLEGRLEARVLEQSLAEIVRRHETLRTTFAEEDGSPVQIISPDAGFTLTSVDLSDQPRTSRERALAELASTEARRPFALDEGPLLRVTLMELDREEQALLLTVHHIAADGWALEILFGELAALYEAFGADRPSPLPGLRVQYADFALWQRKWVQAGALRDQLAYWRGQLGLPLPTLDLPFARPRPAAVAYRGRKTSRLLGREVVDDLWALGRREGLTLFMILLAAFVTLLYRVTGQKDIVVGTSVANRTRLEVEGLIGCFVNTLPLRTDLSGNPTFRDLLDRVREVTLAAFTHQDVPFDLLVDTLQLPRDPSRPPLVAVLFDLHESPLCPPVLGRARVTPLEVDAGVSKFDFNLEATAGPGGLDLALYYRRDLYEPRAMEGFLDQYHHLLAAVAADAGRRLEALPLGTEQDQLSPDTLDELFAEERGT